MCSFGHNHRNPSCITIAAKPADPTLHSHPTLTALPNATRRGVAEFLAVFHEGAPTRAMIDFAEFDRLVGEWFPVRPVATDAALRTPAGSTPDSLAALALAETLNVPLVTRNDDIRSGKVPVLYS